MLFDAGGAIAAVKETGGHAVAVPDDAIWDSQRLLARRHGILVEPAGATALTGLRADHDAGRLEPDDEPIVILSGAGYKDLAGLQRMGDTGPVPVIHPEEMSGALKEMARDEADV
jgi:threonine synthase